MERKASFPATRSLIFSSANGCSNIRAWIAWSSEMTLSLGVSNSLVSSISNWLPRPGFDPDIVRNVAARHNIYQLRAQAAGRSAGYQATLSAVFRHGHDDVQNPKLSQICDRSARRSGGPGLTNPALRRHHLPQSQD